MHSGIAIDKGTQCLLHGRPTKYKGALCIVEIYYTKVHYQSYIMHGGIAIDKGTQGLLHGRPTKYKGALCIVESYSTKVHCPLCMVEVNHTMVKFA